MVDWAGGYHDPRKAPCRSLSLTSDMLLIAAGRLLTGQDPMDLRKLTNPKVRGAIEALQAGDKNGMACAFRGRREADR
jgi:hypothetical protein